MEEKSKTPVIVGGLIALVVIGGGLLMISNNNKDDNKAANSSNTQQQNPPKEDAMEKKSIVAVAISTDSLSTLVTAVKAAGLVETLSGEGPFTVFAPTNEAFAALPAGTVDTLLKPENKDQLAGILTYHVVSGKVLSSELKNGQEITTVQGGKLKVEITNGMVYIVDAKGNKAKVEKADVKADNGVVHVISGVLLPA